MHKLTTIINLILIILFLSACSEKTQTIEWYLEHRDKLKEEVIKCKKKTLEELLQDKHCQVIKKAQDKIIFEHEKNAPLPTFK